MIILLFQWNKINKAVIRIKEKEREREKYTQHKTNLYTNAGAVISKRIHNKNTHIHGKLMTKSNNNKKPNTINLQKKKSDEQIHTLNGTVIDLTKKKAERERGEKRKA